MKTVTEILIDISGSMKGKISSAKKMLLDEVIPTMDFSDKIAIKTFTSYNKKPKINPILSLSITNKEQLKEAVSKINITVSGGTPIAAAIRDSVSSLKEFMAFEKRIILLTDGQESDGGNYGFEARQAIKKGINCQIHIIGIGLKEAAMKKAQRISSISGGTFSNVTFGSSYNSTKVKSSLQKFSSQFVKSTLKVITKSIPRIKKPIQKKIVKPIIKKKEFPNKEEEVIKPKMENTNQEEIALKVEQNSQILETIVEQLNQISNKVESISTSSNNELNEELEIFEDKELNEKIRKVSEQFVFDKLTEKYSENIKWLNSNGIESYSDHDFEVIDIDGTVEYYIDCKGTIGEKKTFMMTSNEWRLFLNHTKNYQIFLVTNCLKKPNLTKIDNLLDWILKGKVVPYSEKNIKLKSERIYFTILE